MKKSKGVFIRVNKEFILITSFIEGWFSMTDPDQEFIFNPVDISNAVLGCLVREKFNESKNLPIKEFQAIFNSEKRKG
ncbi:contact-dependent growth inhibition system immunity protein, partial [Rodentibacter genomosp. 2]|uniref:contact-dependent growth inhibition system immunity protein n=1 Tax=Rodentibacter genomosp. 2 TaxID=1908266 RepID=UPI00117A5F88